MTRRASPAAAAAPAAADGERGVIGEVVHFFATLVVSLFPGYVPPPPPVRACASSRALRRAARAISRLDSRNFF